MKDTDVRNPPVMIGDLEPSDTKAEKNESDDAGLMTVPMRHKTRDAVQLLLENTEVIV